MAIASSAFSVVAPLFIRAFSQLRVTWPRYRCESDLWKCCLSLHCGLRSNSGHVTAPVMRIVFMEVSLVLSFGRSVKFGSRDRACIANRVTESVARLFIWAFGQLRVTWLCKKCTPKSGIYERFPPRLPNEFRGAVSKRKAASLGHVVLYKTLYTTWSGETIPIGCRKGGSSGETRGLYHDETVGPYFRLKSSYGGPRTEQSMPRPWEWLVLRIKCLYMVETGRHELCLPEGSGQQEGASSWWVLLIHDFVWRDGGSVRSAAHLVHG